MNGLDDAATWHQGDLYGALPETVTSPRFDVILANPPYWPAHNKLLFHAGGLDGEAVTKRVVSDGTPLLKDNGLMFIVTPIFNTDKAGPGSAPVLERIRSWGWPASMKSVVLYGSTREDKDFYDLFNAKKPPITREMLDDVGIINAAEGAVQFRAVLKNELISSFCLFVFCQRNFVAAAFLGVATLELLLKSVLRAVSRNQRV